jgi:hypothetical protein
MIYKLLSLLFNGTVWSKLKYTSIIWSHAHNSNQNQIIYLPIKIKVLYIKLLKEFNYVTLASRCHISEQAFLYKIVNGVLDNSKFLEQLNFNIRKGNLHTRYLFPYHIPKTVMYKNLPLLRMCNVYNSVAVKYPELDFSLSFVQCLKLLKSIFMS